MFSSTSEYAIRATMELATRPLDGRYLAAELGEALDIPQHYLAKILQQLVRARVLKSMRGRRGGFSLARAPEEITLHDIVAPFEDMKRYEECILGQRVCNDNNACPLHDYWKETRKKFMDELHTKTLEDISEFQIRCLKKMRPAARKRLGPVPGKTSLKK